VTGFGHRHEPGKAWRMRRVVARDHHHHLIIIITIIIYNQPIIE
jgi:hypothetical protein